MRAARALLLLGALCAAGSGVVQAKHSSWEEACAARPEPWAPVDAPIPDTILTKAYKEGIQRWNKSGLDYDYEPYYCETPEWASGGCSRDTDWGSVYQFEVNATCGEYTVTLVADVAYWNNETYVWDVQVVETYKGGVWNDYDHSAVWWKKNDADWWPAPPAEKPCECPPAGECTKDWCYEKYPCPETAPCPTYDKAWCTEKYPCAKSGGY